MPAQFLTLVTGIRDYPRAVGHNANGIVTYGPAQRAYALPELIQVVKAGDFESMLSFGVGVAQKAPIHMYAQPKLGRVVLDIKAPY